MNKSDLTHLITARIESMNLGVPKSAIHDILDETFDAITESLSRGEEVRITGFGTFTVKERAARTGRNPATGELVDIPARMSAAFRPGKRLKDAIV